MIKADKGDMKIAIPLQSKEREASVHPNLVKRRLKIDMQINILAASLNRLLPFRGMKIHTNLVIMLKTE